MPTWDYKCNNCGRIETRWFGSHSEMTARESQGPAPCKPNQKKCKGSMVRQPSAPNFSVRGFNATNGYSNKGVV